MEVFRTFGYLKNTIMKELSEAFVIILEYRGVMEYFQNYISFDKNDLDTKCNELNKAFREKTKVFGELLSLPYRIINLQEAIQNYADYLYDTYTTHDESY